MQTTQRTNTTDFKRSRGLYTNLHEFARREGKGPRERNVGSFESKRWGQENGKRISGAIMTGEELVARDKARAKLSPEERLLWSNDPASGVHYEPTRPSLSQACNFMTLSPLKNNSICRQKFCIRRGQYCIFFESVLAKKGN